MNPDSTVEYNSLSWVKKQLDAVLTDAQGSLGEYIESRDEAQLAQCIDHLKLVYGTLQMVEVYGAAMLAEEMQQTAMALQSGRVERIEDAFDVLMRAMLQLPDYLESIQGGARDTPILLMALINDLRAARNDNLLSESVLFVAETENVQLDSTAYDAANIEAGKLASEVKRLRTHFQLGLLDILKNNKEHAGLQRIKAVLSALEKATFDDEVRRLWMVAGAMVEGLMHEGIDNNISVKMLLGAIDRQLKSILTEGEEDFAKNYSRDLLKNILYYVGSCTSDSKRVLAVKQAYKLEELIPSDREHDAASIGGLNADLFDTVSKGIVEDLFQVKDALELYMQSDDQGTEQLAPVSEQLSRIADTFGMLSMGSTRQHIVEQRNIIDRLISGEESISEPLILGVASELLNAESDLKSFIADRSGYVDQREDDGCIVPAAEYRQVILTVVDEALKNFAAAKEALLSYISGIGDQEQLDIILNKLEEVRGVALMLPLGRVESLIDRLKDYVRIALRDNERTSDAEEQDAVADVVTAIEYYLEALSEGQPGVEQGLDAGDRAASKLVEIYSQYAQEQTIAADEESGIDRDEQASPALAEIAPDEIEPEKTESEETEPTEKDQGEAELVIEDSIDEADAETPATSLETGTDQTASSPAYAYTILGDDADEEIVEIFIEEAVEVLGEMHTYFPQWKANHEDEEALGVIRRSFHTLKGSGRLIGAELIGEFSWKFENVLNRVIDNKISVSSNLFNAIDEALAVLPQLIEQLKGNREPISNINALMATADALAEGKDVALTGSTAADEADSLPEEILDEPLEATEEESESEMAEISVDELETVDVADEPEAVELVDGMEDTVAMPEQDDTPAEAQALPATAAPDEAVDDSSTPDNVIDISSVMNAADSTLSLLDADTAEESSAAEPAPDAGEVENETTGAAGSDEEEALLTIDEDETGTTDELEEISVIDLDDSEMEVIEDDFDLETEFGAGDQDEAGVDTRSDTAAVDEELPDDIDSNDRPGLADTDNDVVSLSEADALPDESDAFLDELAASEDEQRGAAPEDDENVHLAVDEAIDFKQSDIVTDDKPETPETYVIEIDEEGFDSLDEGNALGIDPMLLQIYHDESVSHLENVRELLRKHDDGEQSLQADKEISRAFHTLYGSARTAEVASIAEISGVAEKYLKAKQDSGSAQLSDEVVELFRDIEQSLTHMLLAVKVGDIPAADKNLVDRINKVLQQEMQSQLQSSISSQVVLEEETGAEDLVVEPVDIGQDENDTVIEPPEVSTDDDSESIVDTAELAITESIQPEAEPESQEGEETDSATVDLAQAASDEQAAPADSTPVDSMTVATTVSYGDIDDELIDIFLEEADELLENCERILQSLRQTPNSAEHIHNLQRNMHTLKGGARMAELLPVGDLTHMLESLVVLVSEQKLETNKAMLDLLQESVDVLTGMMAKVKQRQQLDPVGGLIARIEMLMRGEIAEKRSLERFDLELSDLDETAVPGVEQAEADSGADEENASTGGKRAGDQNKRESDRPHWGERASDVNFVESQELVRVRSDLLNNLVNYAGEVNIYHARLGKQVSDFSFNLSELSQTVVRLKEQLRKLEIETEIQIRSGYEKEADEYDEGFDPLEMDRYSTLQQLSRSLMETAGDVESINNILSEITRDSETLLLQESRVSTDLQEGLMRTRMVRFGGLSSRMRRIVRQVSRELGKEVQLKINGENSEVDRTVLDRIIAPLEHMLRNAVAHGIESPEQRLAHGKDETGTITVTVGRQGTDVIINVKDDGAGISVDKIRQKIIAQGLVSADDKLSDYEILQYILHSGFSTADEVTQVSGRGVGMDVVDNEIKQLGGVLEINTVEGRGTEFNIRLPLTLAINQALLVSTGEDVYAVPLSSIEGVVRITGVELQRFYDSEHSHYEFNGVEYELKHLGSMLSGTQPDYSRQLRLFPVLLVNVGEQHFALHVDDLVGRREIVVKPVGMQIGAVRGIAGATILADGRVVLILEMAALIATDSLFRSAQTVEAEAAEQAGSKPRERMSIMVVDDSITIRKVTERILGRNGFDVILAKDGVDATNKMQDHVPDLMLLDIEMPRMDGFEVATYVRNDARLKDLPIIMITSRTGSKHKEKAMEIGVNQYLGKPYQEEELMNNINNILNLAS